MPPKSKGVTVEHAGAKARAAGIRKGDVIAAVNGHKIGDFIDYMFYKNEPELHMVFQRDNFEYDVSCSGDPGMELEHFKVKTCRNKCIFCFVSQLPKGLRKTLYVKDEDYRMSFLYGNYMTMTNLTDADKKRIVAQRLSPLYISVHSTDRKIRNMMLGNPDAPDIKKELDFLSRNGIKTHAQIVLCPGVNDGERLAKTIKDLYGFHPYLASIAVVPVGLTAHRGHRSAVYAVKAVEQPDAERALDTIEALMKRFKKKHGDPIVFGSDELYIKANRQFPSIEEYGELPQIENGVGMTPHFISSARKIKPFKAEGRYLTFTGVSFYPYLKKYLDKLSKGGMDITPVPVLNVFFGKSVTVAGLLTGRDVIKTVSSFVEGSKKPFDMMLVPDCVLRDGKDVFLDDVTIGAVEKLIGMKTKVIESTPEGLLAPFREH